MATVFHTADAWARLTRTAARSRSPAYVAVAYFADKAASMLPLLPDSMLVVDASEISVRSGRTCPAELRKLVMRGVRVFSVSTLHAKVFAFGKVAFVGSTNVSRHSRDVMIEALVVTDDARVVSAAKRFVHDHCINELGPDELEKLQKLYRPPQFAAAATSKDLKRSKIVLPRVCIAHLERDAPPAESRQSYKSGRAAARMLMEQPRIHELDEFWWVGKLAIRPKDVVVPVVEEPDGRLMVEPPGKVLHVRRWRNGAGSWIFIERRTGQRIALKRLAARIGRGSMTPLMRNGRVTAVLAERIMRYWSRR